MPPTISLVIPALNERQRLPRALDAIRRYFVSREVPWELIVVDDGSTDGTPDLVREYAARVPEVRLIEQGRNRGKGAAVKAGIAACQAPVVGFTDADLAAPIEQLDLLLTDLEEAEVAIVSRALPGSSLGSRQSPLREAMGRAYALLADGLLLRGVPDAQCGLKLFRASAAHEIFELVGEDGITFDTEALLVATQRGLRISQRPAIWNHDHDSRIRFSWSMLVDVALALVRLKLRHRVIWPLTAIGPRQAAAQDALGLIRVESGAPRQQVDEVGAPLA